MSDNLKRSDHYPLRRREVAQALLAERGDLLVDSALGGAAMVGRGLALAQPDRRVLVVTGDGDMLMGLGALATIAAQAPTNLAIAVFDNERYGETGMQVTHTAYDVDLAAAARACGIERTATVRDQATLDAAIPDLLAAPGPIFTTIKIRAEILPFALPPKDGGYLKDRFRLALLGADRAV